MGDAGVRNLPGKPVGPSEKTHVFGRHHVEIDPERIGHEHDMTGSALGVAADIFTVRKNGAGMRRDQACRTIQQRGLSRAVRPDETENFTGKKRERKITNRGGIPAVANRHVTDFQRGLRTSSAVHGGPPFR